MTTLLWILIAGTVFEFFFALDCFKKMLKARKDMEGSQAMLTASVKIVESKEMDLLNVQELLRSKVAENNYLRGLLEDQGIEWESGWRKLS
ncbi:MAG TPA: hypothetical protein VN943_09475 [Candidatus Acidoferrum sp.]|nr:hypothetical protein [Candidatus Acidoferrum sp.]